MHLEKVRARVGVYSTEDIVEEVDIAVLIKSTSELDALFLSSTEI